MAAGNVGENGSLSICIYQLSDINSFTAHRSLEINDNEGLNSFIYFEIVLFAPVFTVINIFLH